MATQIRPNRLEVSDRFPMLGFTVRTDGTAKRFEIAIGTAPELFGPDGKSHRSRSNFYSTRAAGPLPIERGEAVYVLPPEVLARFVGQEKLYYGLATAGNGAGRTEVVTMPGSGSPYINIGGLTGRSLQRVRLLPSRQRLASNYGKAGTEIEWAGDTMTPGTQPATPPPGKNGAKDASSSTAVHYDDGYGPLPPTPPVLAPKPETQPQAKSLADDGSAETEDSLHGIQGPVPDGGATAQGLAGGTSAEYPQASRYEAAAGVNFRSVSGARTINRIVIHITDGGPKINGTIGWFQNPDQRDAKGNPIHVSAHYVIGQDGEVVQMVKHNDVAWHASSANSDSIGIEHVARSPHAWDKLLGHTDPGIMPTETQYCASAALVNWLCSQFSIPMDRTHVLGHSEASPRDHHDGCPNSVWDWDYYMGMVTSSSCMPDPTTASASSLASGGAASKPQHSSKPRASALREVDAGYAPSNAQDALLYMQQFQNRKQAWKTGVPDTTFFPHSATCALRMMMIDGSSASGTGFYIGDDRILTCGHNLAKASSVTIIPGKNGDTEPFGSFTASPSDWTIHPKFDVTVARSSPTGHDFDLAVIKVSTPPPYGGAFRILEELLQCQDSPIIVCGYAAGTVDRNKQHLDGDAIRLLSDSGEVFMYNLQTEGGTSGSPVYYVVARDDEARQQSVLETHLIGVHVDFVQGSNILNEGCRLTADKIAWINSVGNPVSAGASAFSLGNKKRDHAAAGSSIAAPVWAQAAPASTTSGFGVSDDARRTLKCIQRETEQGRSITFIVRYLMKEMSLAETTALSNAGLPIVSCYELNQGDPPITIFTRDKGQKDAKRAFAKAQEVGQPGGTPIYFAIDTDPEPSQRQIVLDYFQGVQEGCDQYLADLQAKGIDPVIYDIGVYGSGLVLDWCQEQGIAKWFWQARAPMWHNNSQVWQGANIHTWTLEDAKPMPCGRETFDRLEGWGNEGGWTVTAAAQGQALSVLLPAPPPKRKYAQGQAVDLSPRLIANSPVNTTTGGEGNITWDLDQFPGVKMAAQSAVGPMQSAETIQLSNWPYCDHTNGGRAAAWFTVDWKFSGQALGQVRISPSGSQQGPQPLRVEARIEDAKNRDASTVALVVHFTYHFSTAGGPEVVALTDLVLYSDGSIDQRSNWTSQVAA
jgi:V8-like Glu-specific endopeptidase